MFSWKDERLIQSGKYRLRNLPVEPFAPQVEMVLNMTSEPKHDELSRIGGSSFLFFSEQVDWGTNQHVCVNGGYNQWQLTL